VAPKWAEHRIDRISSDNNKAGGAVATATAGTALIALLGTMGAFGPLSMDMYLPSLPTLASYFSTSTSKAQMTLSGFTLGFALGQLLYGPISDRYGRKWVLISGVALYVIASYFCATAKDVDTLIFVRILQAIGGGAGVVLTRAIVRDIFDQEAGARALSLMLLVPSLAALVSPFIGGQILLWSDWRGIFWLLAAFGLFILFLGFFRLPETHPPEKRHPTSLKKILRDYLAVLCDRNAFGYMLCGAFSFAGMFAQLSGTPFVYIEVFGVAPEYFGFLFGLNVIGIMVGSYINSRLVMRFGIRRMLVVGTSTALFGGLLLALVVTLNIGGLTAIVLTIAIYMVPHNITNANATSGALEKFPHIAGTASALIGAIRFGMGAAVGALVGVLHDGTALPTAYVIAACAIASAASYWFLTRAPDDAVAGR
jgi:DHA1 family bicyclomycin/chloramphenicol resistance-like MFS transporter